ncbi:MAG TPA: DCC1-like thiol-disulfide oxidoreductase family protein [Pyrinomonadaceae bacterium]|nr:DCC1-like thiol-disulfide oxidoreductase family protein [Pyrinomonadaceae bacterium]
MFALTVLYDPECGLCKRAHEWLAEQTKLVELIFVPCASEDARKRFPQLNHDLTKKDLTVVTDEGAVYFGPKAWLMVLWALDRYRDWAYRLAKPELLPSTKRVVSMISQHRYQISRAAGLNG